MNCKNLLLSALILFGCMLKLHAQAVWTPVNIPDKFTIHELSFANDSVGYFICDTTDFNPRGTVYRTNNRGLTWTPVNGVSYNLKHLDAPSSNVVYVVSNDAGNSILRKSVNGGQFFINVLNACPEGPVDFVNDTLGFIVNSIGFANYLWRTTDGGSSFDSTLLLPGASALYDLQYLTDSVGFAGGLFGPRLATTSQQNTGWSLLSSDFAVTSLCFLTADTGYITAEYLPQPGVYTVARTTDAGQSFTLLPINSNAGWTKIHCRNALECICVSSSGEIASTNDAGQSWNFETSGTSLTLRDVYFGSDYAIAVGDSGIVLRRSQLVQGLEQNDDNNAQFRIDLNPVNETLHLSGDFSGPVQLTLYTLAGTRVADKKIQCNCNRITIDVSDLEKGMYLVRLSGQQGTGVLRFIRG